ncbi:MAG TPA: hypothetical protein GX527_07730, partial [Clostridiaceae bacterium]|nr:hypothetical protein [Clostridiaceae bacterium]
MKRLALFMCIVMLIGMLPIASFAIKAIDESRSFSDMPNDWSTAALHSAVDNKLLVGFDGKLMPNGQL